MINLLSAQSQLDNLIAEGIKYHDKQEYFKAIDIYKQALEIDPNSLIANYEIALSYMYAEDYYKSIEHANKVIGKKSEYESLAYIIKGSCLDYIGKTEEAIKLFKSAIKKNKNEHLLYYNLGLTYYNAEYYDKAEEALTSAIYIMPTHASSHLLLGYLMSDRHERIKSILCFHFFLFLEPNSDRSPEAYSLLRSQFAGNVKKDTLDPNTINIVVNTEDTEKEFFGIETMLSMLEATKDNAENANKTDEVIFKENSTKFFKMLGEKMSKNKKGLWWNFYIPFFNYIANSDYMETYCYYISSSQEKAQQWFKENPTKLDEFYDWINSD